VDPVSGLLVRTNYDGANQLLEQDKEQEVVRFIVWLCDREPYEGKRKHDVLSLRGSTIASYVSTARKRLELLTDERLVYTVKSRMLNARLKAMPAPPRFKEPIPKEVVYNLLRDSDISIGILMAVALAWFLTLRLGESVLSQLSDVYNSARTTRREDIEFVFDDDDEVVAVRITTRGAKNDPYNEGGVKILYKSTQADALCPVTLFMEYWEITNELGFADAEPLIRHLDGKLVTPRQVSKQLKRHAQLLGYNPAFFANHSTRIGGATAMLEAEVPMPTMQKQGNWRSKRGIFPYLRHSDLMLHKVSTSLALKPQSASLRNVGKLAAGQMFSRSRQSDTGVRQAPAVL
jgi:hypothetical protein